MNWDDVRFFVAACRAGTLSGAARELAVDQSTVSRRLSALERSLGVKLFDRTPDGLLPTVEGARLRAAGDGVEQAVLEFERHASGEDARLEGSVRLATSDPIASRFLLPRLGLIRERHPGIHLELVIARALADLSRREADLALRVVFSGSQPAEPSLVARKIADVAFAVYGSRDYLDRHGLPASDDDLRRYEFLSYAAGFRQPGAEWLAAHVGEPRVAMRCETMISMHAALTAGHGLGVLFCFAAEGDPSLLRVTAPIEHAGLWLVVHPDLKDKPRVRAVMDVLTEMVKDSAALFGGDAAAPSRAPAVVASS
jgi:DNA-binding transcriptional LysR family regulator